MIWSLFGLWLPRRAGSSKHSPRSSISIALTTARLPMPPDRRTGWTRTSERAGSACSLPKRVGDSSVLRSRWTFRLHCGSATFGRSETWSSSRRTDGSELVAPSSLQYERLQSQRDVLRLVVQTEDDNDPALRLYADSGYTLIKGYCHRIPDASSCSGVIPERWPRRGAPVTVAVYGRRRLRHESFAVGANRLSIKSKDAL